VGPACNFTGQTIFVPARTPTPGQPSAATFTGPGHGNTFNDNGTYTGCVFDSRGNLFAVDIVRRKGSSRRLTMAPDRVVRRHELHDLLLLFGPTMGGDAGTGHHVDGSGGLRDPGTLARDDADNIYVPRGALDPATGQLPGFGRVLEFLRSSFPADASRSRAFEHAAGPVSVQVFIQGSRRRNPSPWESPVIRRLTGGR